MGSTFLSLWTVIILICFILSQNSGGTLSPDKVPILWPYEDGTVRISSPKFQKILYFQKDFQYIVWFKCVANCTSVQEHVWLRVARMDNKGSIIIEDTTDVKDYGLDIRGILTLRNQTVQNNGTEYRIDIRMWGIESDHITLLYFEEQPVKKVESNKTDQIQACNSNNSNSSGIDGNGSGNKDTAGITDPFVNGTNWKKAFWIVTVLFCVSFLALVVLVVHLFCHSFNHYNSVEMIYERGDPVVSPPQYFNTESEIGRNKAAFDDGDDDAMLEV